jgi:glucosamine--fructose-6-phosphate aminotransferase (isomerizing)
VVAVSQSGESTDINVVLEDAKRQGTFTLGITNEAGSSLASMADHAVLVRAGRERSVAATKTYTGQLLSFYLLAWALGAKLEISDLKKLAASAAEALKLEKEIAHRAERYRFMDHAVVIGRGLNYANAFEWALKLMETSYIVAERFSQADLLHGPIAMVEHSFPAFVLAPPGPTWTAMEPMLGRLAAVGAETLVLTDRSNSAAPKNAVSIPALLAYRSKLHPSLPADLYTPVPYIIPAQLFAGHLAAVKGLNPDAPRGLNKVTRTL